MAPSIRAHLHNLAKAEYDGRVLVLWLALAQHHAVLGLHVLGQPHAAKQGNSQRAAA